MWQLLAQSIDVEVTRNPYDPSWWANWGVLGLVVFFGSLFLWRVWVRFTDEKNGYATIVVASHKQFLETVTEQTERQTEILSGLHSKVDMAADKASKLHAALVHGLEAAERHVRKHNKDSDAIIELRNVREKLD
jgi:hypothetical protein